MLKGLSGAHDRNMLADVSTDLRHERTAKRQAEQTVIEVVTRILFSLAWGQAALRLSCPRSWCRLHWLFIAVAKWVLCHIC
jgi:hypothetical protein